MAAVVVVGVPVQLLRNQVCQLLYCEMTLVPFNGNPNLTREGARLGNVRNRECVGKSGGEDEAR